MKKITDKQILDWLESSRPLAHENGVYKLLVNGAEPFKSSSWVVGTKLRDVVKEAIRNQVKL